MTAEGTVYTAASGDPEPECLLAAPQSSKTNMEEISL
jgi:hypothetical protein